MSAERAFDPTLKAGEVRYYDIQNMISAEHVRFIVAERGGELVAADSPASMMPRPIYSTPKQAYLGLMYVDPRYRGRSVNGGIVELLKQWCRGKGATELRLEVYNGNSAAIGAYEKAGFSKHMIEMRLSLDSP